MTLALVGDIGGTNARFALWRGRRLEAVRVLRTVDHASPEQAIRSYLHDIGEDGAALGAVCLACAGPVSGDEFVFTNNHWRISRQAFRQALGLDELLLINDFTAMALGITWLGDDELVTICPGAGDTDRLRLVIGPGTGLGVAGLLPENGGWRVLPSEGGHACLPVGNRHEAALWLHLHDRFGHVSAEAALSGNGLLEIYRASCQLDGVAPRFTAPAQITAAALAGDAQAVQTLEQFCVWLGRVAGDAVLTLGARGGVYLAGGILPRFVEFLRGSGFLSSFRDKGRMRRYFDDIPVWLVTAEHPGLLGAGVALQQARPGTP
jgi:glucokinase